MRALVLAAGLGTRLGALTTDVPKALLDVAGRPLLDYVIGNLHRHAYDELAVNLHFRADLVRSALGDGSRLGVAITYLEEQELLGTAGAVANARAFLSGAASFLVQYGDVVTDHDLSALTRFHGASGGDATVLVHRREWANSVVSVDDAGRVTAFVERPRGDVPVPVGAGWVYSGVCVCSPAMLDIVPEQGDLPRDVFPRLAEEGRLFAQPLEGYRCAVDSPERYATLQADVEAGAMRMTFES